MNTEKDNRALLFVGGALLGAAVGYFANTPKGKKLRNDVVEKGKKISEDVTSSASSLVNEMKSNAGKVIENASKSIAELQHKLNEASITLADEAQDQLDAFDEGVKKARSVLKNNS